MKRIVLGILTACLVLALTGCSTWVNLMQTLGFDVGDYDGEEIVAWYEADSEEAKSFVGMIQMMLLSSPIMEEFSGASAAFDAYEDAVLNAMLCESFARYAGNTELMKGAASAYPELELTTLIPGADFESQFYKMFGGSWKIVHASGSLFTYLDRVNAYTAMTEPQFTIVSTEFISLIETENTYRLVFRNSVGDVTSPDYEALLIKREDGTVYIRSLAVKAAIS